MPELPEVEIVTRNLNQILKPPFEILGWKFMRADLRFPIPQKQLRKLATQKIHKIERRAKYILFFLEKNVVISHLGMTGSWRVESSGWMRRKHDHLAFEFKKGQHLVYEDARRFGFVEVVPLAQMLKRFSHVGPEPLASDFSVEAITAAFRKMNSPIKNAIMNQKFIVGVGNIYASEILFKSRVSPLKKCSRVTEKQYVEIWKNTQEILKSAIESGGSTIENYKNSYGESGAFQNQFRVYGRDQEKCLDCGTLIKSKLLAGRNTFWCSNCQK